MKANNAVELIVEKVEAAGFEIDRRKRAGIGSYAKKLLAKGATEQQFEAWANHYGDRLADGAHIRPSQAWEDVTKEESTDEVESTTPRVSAADKRIKQAVALYLLDGDPRRPLTAKEKARIAEIEQRPIREAS